MIRIQSAFSGVLLYGSLRFIVFILIISFNIPFATAQQPFDIESRLTAGDGTVGDKFGSDVTNDGELALIGAPGTQAVYAFHFNGSFWEEIQKLSGPAGGAFGTTLDINGDYAIVGDRLDDDLCGGSTGCNAGAAYIYRFDGVEWKLVKKIFAEDGAQGNNFGFDVAISNDQAIVSAQYDNNNNQNNQDYRFQGSVYIFQRDAGGIGNWGQVAKFKSADLADGRSDEFGRSVDISGDYAVVGAKNNDSGIDQNGSVYVFFHNQNGPEVWSEKTILKLQNVGPEGGNFGLEVDIAGELIAVGDNSDQKDDLGIPVSGSVSIYRLNNNVWASESILFPTDAVKYGRYFVLYGEDIAIVPESGVSAYMYRFQEGEWVEKPKITNADNFNISGAVSLSGVTLITGAASYAGQKGAAYFFEFIATPGGIRATDGKYLNRTVITWKNRSNQADGFRIYRDGIEAGSALSVATTYNDYDAVPGKIHTYQVSSYNNTWNESSLSRSDLGWAQARGEIRGNVKTEQGAAIKNVAISITDKSHEAGTYLNFDGAGSYVQLPYLPRTNQMTLSAWIRTTADTDQQIIGWGSAAEESTIEFKLFPGGRLAYAEWSGSDWSPVTSNRAINDGTWHFVTAVIGNDTCRLYIDGELDMTGTGFMRDIVVTTTSIGAYDRGFAVQQFFKGDIDDVRMWNRVRTEDELRFEMLNSLDGNETGLVGYWTFDDSTRSGASVAADYTHDGGHHGIIEGAKWKNGERPVLKYTTTDADGEYRIKSFYFEDEKEFRITPYKEKHLFDPEYLDMVLDGGLGGSAAFTDTTSFTVSGRITHTGTFCGAEGVELLLNDDPTGVFTNAAGEYNLAIEEPGLEYTITPVLGDSDRAHHFEPAEIAMVVEDDIAGIDFIDTEKHLLYGKVRGGCIAGLGTARLRITGDADPGCFDTTIVTDVIGNFRLFLPAQLYKVDLIGIDNPDSLDILSFFEPETADLRFENQRIYFIYHPRPIIQLTFFPDERTCDPAAVPIMQQSLRYDLLIEVLEAYGTDTCYVTSGQVSIYDDIGGNPTEPVTLPVQNGKINYTIIPGVPNILGGGEHPYQKLLQITADVEGRSGSLEQWILVTGQRPRTQTFFSAATPELPLMILRDPPGDQSYSFLTKGTTYTTNFTQSLDTSATSGAFLDLNLGIVAGGGYTVPFVGVHLESDWGGYGKFGISTHKGKGSVSSNLTSVSLTMTEEFKTSENEDAPGAASDVIIGASLNQTFFLADIIEYDHVRCQVAKDTALAFINSGFSSTYAYTEDHIRNTLIPQLEELKALSGPDSTFDYEQAVSVWRQVLNYNDSLKSAAQIQRENEAIPDPEYLRENNISFSGGSSVTQYTTIQYDSNSTFTYKQIFDRDKLGGLGIVLAGVTTELGWQWNMQSVRDTTYDTTYTDIKTTGYTLADDDPGDFFSVDIKHDPVFGTPVFDLVAGTSSCPWEPDTQPRDGVQLGIDTYVQNDVPPDEPATFTLTLGNTSESGESRPYDLRMVQLSNPDGAIIKVGGVPMGDALSYYIPAGDSAYQATLTVERGPRAYDYDNLQIMMVPPCEFELYNSSTAFADTVTFSVHFASPLSDANLTFPVNDWMVNPGDPDSLAVVINNYNVHNDYLKKLKLQYRKPDRSWITAIEVPKDQLPDQNLKRHWDYQNLEDGNYELRVVSDGGAYGVRYSPVARGHIERNALLVSGKPEPSDQVLNREDQIGISFAEGINPEKLDPERDITLIDAADSSRLAFSVAIEGNRLTINPELTFDALGSRTLLAQVSNIEDSDGNRLRQPVTWQFTVDQHTAYWKSFPSDMRIYQGQEMVKTAVLYNAGSTGTEYRMVYLPSWISLSKDDLSGSISAGSERYLTLHFDPQFIPGLLNDSVVVSLAGADAFRPISLSVLPEPPLWSREEPAGGTYITQVYARLVMNGQASTDEFDMAGVFIDDQLAGLGHVTKNSTTGFAIAAFPVYYNAPLGDNLEFRFWDASEGKEYRYYSDEYRFEAGVSIGNRFDPVILEPNEVVQTIPIETGWNWISFNVATPDLSIERVLKNYPAEPGDVIKGQFGFSEYTGENGWTGTLDFLRPETAYRLNSRNSKELFTAGRPASNWVTPAKLFPGWNWIGYLPEKPLTLKDALYFVQAVPGDMIRSRDRSAIYNNNGEWLGTLRELQPGQGYLLYTGANSELVYPDLKKGQTGGTTGYPEKPDWKVDARSYESNMTVVGALEFKGHEYGDSTFIVAVFKDGQCRGVTRPVYVTHLERSVTFMMIYGSPEEAGDSVSVRIYDPSNEVTRDVADALIFGSDAHLGHLQEPLVFKALETDAERIPSVFYLKQNYPNPFNPLTTIEYGLPVDDDITLTVFNVLGQKVTVLVDKSQRAGRYKIQFDAGKAGLASGIYFYQIRTQGFSKSYKMLLLK